MNNLDWKPSSLLSPYKSSKTAASATDCTSFAIAVVSVLAFSVEKTLFGTDVGAGEADLDDTAGAVGCATAAGFGGETFAGGGVGLEPPMFNEIVGGGGGAFACSGRSVGGGGGWDGCWPGIEKPLPGTNSKAPALSLLMVCRIE